DHVPDLRAKKRTHLRTLLDGCGKLSAGLRPQFVYRLCVDSEETMGSVLIDRLQRNRLRVFQLRFRGTNDHRLDGAFGLGHSGVSDYLNRSRQFDRRGPARKRKSVDDAVREEWTRE